MSETVLSEFLTKYKEDHEEVVQEDDLVTPPKAEVVFNQEMNPFKVVEFNQDIENENIPVFEKNQEHVKSKQVLGIVLNIFQQLGYFLFVEHTYETIKGLFAFLTILFIIRHFEEIMGLIMICIFMVLFVAMLFAAIRYILFGGRRRW